MADVKQTYQQGYSDDKMTVGYYSETIDGVKGDTEICIDPNEGNGVTLCTIAGSDIESFDKELTELLEKYRI